MDKDVVDLEFFFVEWWYVICIFVDYEIDVKLLEVMMFYFGYEIDCFIEFSVLDNEVDVLV